MRPQGEMGIYGQDTGVGRWPRSRGSQRQPQRQRAGECVRCVRPACGDSGECVHCVGAQQASRILDGLRCASGHSHLIRRRRISGSSSSLPRSFSSVAHHPFSQRQSAFVHPPTSRAASPAVECSLCSLPPVWVAHLGFQVASFITPAFAGCLVIIFCFAACLVIIFWTHRLITTSVAMHTHRYHTQPSTARESVVETKKRCIQLLSSVRAVLLSGERCALSQIHPLAAPFSARC